jgi:hypothetical protein
MKIITTTFFLILITTFAFATQEKKQIKIRLTAPGGYLDETTVYFDYDVTPAYTANQDAPKAYNTITNAPSIYSTSSDNVFCSTNGYSELAASEIIALGIRTDTSGLHIFTASIFHNFDSTTIIQLEDRQENIFTNLRTNFYAVQLTDSLILNGRFFLHVSRAVKFTSATAGCSNNDGVLQLNQDNTILWNSYNLYDSTGYLVESAENVSGNFNFNNLAEGNYSLVMAFGSDVIIKVIHVNGNYIVAQINPSTINAAVNQPITFYTASHNVTTYDWTMGDITETKISGVANPEFAYLQSGIYNVVLTSANSAGCVYRDSVTVTISAATGINNMNSDTRNITSNTSTVTIVLNEEVKQGAELKIYNLLGQMVYGNSVTELTTTIALNDQPTGYYVVSFTNNQTVSTKQVFIGK